MDNSIFEKQAESLNVYEALSMAIAALDRVKDFPLSMGERIDVDSALARLASVAESFANELELSLKSGLN